MSQLEATPQSRVFVNFQPAHFIANHSTLVVALLMLLFFGLTSSNFLLPNNIFNIFRQMSVVAVLGIGMSIVILIGGIDLSVGSTLFLSAGLSALLIRDGTTAPIAILVGLIGSLLVGLVNGLLIEVASISPVITTLGTLIGVRGLAQVIMSNAQIRVTDPFFEFIAITRTPGIPAINLPGIPLIAIVVLLLYIIAAFTLRQTLFGRYIYAIGGNQVAARLSGIPVVSIKVLTYTLCGFVSGIGGLLIAASTGVISPNLGAGSEFYAIAAVVLGGTRLSGGVGRVEKTLLGAFMLYMVLNYMTLRRIPAEWQQAATGFLLLAAILIDRFGQRWREARS
jgi:ribose transport system permease protein